jgi:hypothetical protein
MTVLVGGVSNLRDDGALVESATGGGRMKPENGLKKSRCAGG